jgi:glycosyltransferase involved in cell wall biosynthesis
MRPTPQASPAPAPAPAEPAPARRPLDVVVLNFELPYPANLGNRIRTLNLLLQLAGRHRITFLARRNRDPAEADRAAAFLASKGIDAVFVDAPVPPRSGPRFYAKLAANLASPLPYPVAAHLSAGMRAAVERLAAERPVDLWQAESTAFIDALRGVADRPKLVIAHNVETLIWRRYRETEASPLKRWYITQQWRKYERFERRAFAEATRVVAVSAEDARLMREDFGARRVDVVDNGIDRAFFEAVERAPRPGRILFLGSLSWRPNLDAIGLLLDRIFPAVRAAVPGATLALVGRSPSEALARRVAGTAGVELHADVPDVRPFLAESAVMAVPLRVGGGSRLKILEAMAAGLPVVSTRVGAEGLEIEPGRDYVAADDPGALAEALVGCLRDPGPAEAAARAARPRVLDRYDWTGLAADLERSWYHCLEDHAAPTTPGAGAPRPAS